MHLSHAIVSGALLASASARIPKFWNLQGNKELYAHNQLKVRQAPLPAGCSRNSINSLLNGNDGSTDFCRAFLNGDNVVTETNFLGGGTQTIETVVIISDLPVSDGRAVTLTAPYPFGNNSQVAGNGTGVVSTGFIGPTAIGTAPPPALTEFANVTASAGIFEARTSFFIPPFLQGVNNNTRLSIECDCFLGGIAGATGVPGSNGNVINANFANSPAATATLNVAGGALVQTVEVLKTEDQRQTQQGGNGGNERSDVTTTTTRTIEPTNPPPASTPESPTTTETPETTVPGQSSIVVTSSGFFNSTTSPGPSPSPVPVSTSEVPATSTSAPVTSSEVRTSTSVVPSSSQSPASSSEVSSTSSVVPVTSSSSVTLVTSSAVSSTIISTSSAESSSSSDVVSTSSVESSSSVVPTSTIVSTSSVESSSSVIPTSSSESSSTVVPSTSSAESTSTVVSTSSVESSSSVVSTSSIESSSTVVPSTSSAASSTSSAESTSSVVSSRPTEPVPPPPTFISTTTFSSTIPFTSFSNSTTPTTTVPATSSSTTCSPTATCTQADPLPGCVKQQDIITRVTITSPEQCREACNCQAGCKSYQLGRNFLTGEINQCALMDLDANNSYDPVTTDQSPAYCKNNFFIYDYNCPRQAGKP